MEDAAIKGIFRLFTKQWSTTSQKGTNEVMNLVLKQIIGACVTEPGDSNTKESIQLQHANEYLESLRRKIASGKNFNILFTGNNLEDTISNLTAISNAAKNEEYSKDIQNRLRPFIHQLSELQQTYINSSRIVLLISVFIGAFVTYIFCKELVTDYASAANYLIAILSFGFISLASYRVISHFR